MLKAWNFGELNQALTDIIGSAAHILPELLLAGLLCILVVVDLIAGKKRQKVTFSFSLIALLSVFGVLALQAGKVTQQAAMPLFGGMVLSDGLAIAFKLIFSLAAVMTVLLTFSRSKEDLHQSGEYHSLLAGTLLGTFLMVMTTNLLMLYLSIELVSICSYILTNFNRQHKSAESALKYFLFGAMSSGVMLYGISLFYGFSGTLDFTSQAFIHGISQIDSLPLMLAAFMVIAGFLFKISAFPFHIWTPDVYEGAPTSIVAFFSVAPKLAGVAVIIRYLAALKGHMAMDLDIDWFTLLAVIAILTMTIGNFSALWQNNAKRMMAYSSIGHAGLMLAAVLAYSVLGIQSILFYGTVYLAMNFAAFLMIQIISERTDKENISEYQGMGISHPFLAAMMLIVMISLTGIPPTAGFTAKFLVFSSLLQTYQQGGDVMVLYLIIAGLINTVVSLFYYLKIPYFMYFKKGDTADFSLSLYDKALTVILTAPLLILFFQSGWLMNLINHIKYLF
jgi:NADH-quinone oxidoreductase subunit N